MDIINYIPKGRKNAVTREQLIILTGLCDRRVRREIAKARREYVIINLQNNRGYYQPDMNDLADVSEIRQYVEQETHRLKSIGWSLKSARMALKEAENEQ